MDYYELNGNVEKLESDESGCMTYQDVWISPKLIVSIARKAFEAGFEEGKLEA